MDLTSPFASLRGTTAVVTGSARGIGFDVARAALGVGMHVVLADRDADALGAAHAELGSPAVTPVVCDLAVDDGLAAVEAALGALPRCGLWVNNAGVVSHQALEEVTTAEWERVQATNAAGVLRGLQAAYRHMVGSGGGAIVNIASLAVEKVLPLRSSYAASKSAVVSMTRYAAQEWGPLGIRVNAIAPGFIDTRLTRWADDDPRQVAKLETVARIASRRVGQPSDIANAVLFLASDLASYVAGEILHVDGGWHLV